MFGTVILSLTEGFMTTLKLFGLTLLLSLPLGMVFAWGSMNHWAPLKFLSSKGKNGRLRSVLAGICPVKVLVDFFVWIIRGTPLVLQLIVIYYGPGLIFDNNIWGSGNQGRMIAVLAAFVLNYSCYFSVILRGGIQSIPRGQTEAGQVLAMTKTQIFFRVILLQMIKRVLPPLSNEIITLVKDTSLARVIAITEVIKAGEVFLKKGLLWPLLFTGVYFLLFVGILTLLFSYLERKLQYFR